MRSISPKALGVFLVAMAAMSGSTVLRAAEPDGPEALIGAKEALIIAVSTRAGDKFGKTASRAEQKGILDYYAAPDAKLLWVDENGLTSSAKAVMAEIGKADDYGLRASDYDLPRANGLGGGDTQALADAEIKLSLAALRYARDARGGRIEPVRLDPNLDPTLALPDPLQVMESLAIRSDAAGYLRSFQPSQPQFEALRKALLAARGGNKPDDDIVRVPDGPALKLGVEDEQVELLRTRLNIETPAAGDAKRFDEAVEEAVKRFQMTHGAVPDGVVGPGTRRLLNRQGQSASNPTRVKQILINMERWRWLPSDLGSFYVAANIPEFMVKVVDDGKPVFTTRIVVGKPDKQTPVFSNEMQEIVFNPYWNVPNSIKVDELMPSIRGGGDWFFGGGGGGWDTSVFERNGLRVAIGNREVDPSTLDWSRIDIRSLNVYQPPGPTNVLGTIKFLFPNKHDVYMHDTTQKNLFAKTVRAESHGCMRVQNPDQFAVTLLKRVQGWQASQVASAIATGEDQHVPLKRKIPVYITYFTLWVNADGSISTFNDIYGHDSRMAAALFGEPLPMAYEQPQMVEDYAVNQPPPRAYQQQQPQRRRGNGRPINTIADSISAFINN